MTLVDGKKIAGDILETVKAAVAAKPVAPRLMVLACEPNFETQKYLTLKKSKAETLGIALTVQILPAGVGTAVLEAAIIEAVPHVDGIVIQLPLPAQIDTGAVLRAVPPEKDVDAFLYHQLGAPVLPPVVGAIDAISAVHSVVWQGKSVVIFGSGRLVGAPAGRYAKERGAVVTIVTEATENVAALTTAADIIILGVGKQNLLTPDMVKPGVVVFDAGASEDGGLIVGDARPDVADKAALFTPVPGGIGPITIALLFRNLVDLQNRQ